MAVYHHGGNFLDTYCFLWTGLYLIYSFHLFFLLLSDGTGEDRKEMRENQVELPGCSIFYSPFKLLLDRRLGKLAKGSE